MALVPAVRLMDALLSIAPFRLPSSREGFESLLMDPHVDDSPTIDELGIQRTMPFEETLAGMVRWMYQSGGISAKLAAKLAD